MFFPAPAPALPQVLGSASAESPGRSEPASRLREDVESRAEAGDPDGAVALGERAVREFPDNSALWLSLGEAYGAKARAASVVKRLPFARKCKAAFEKAVDLDPSNIEARSALFEYCLEAPSIAGGSVTLARSQAAEIAKRNRCRGHLAFASLASRDGDLPREESELRQALEAAAGPDEAADANCQLALLYEKLGKKAEAIDALKETLRLRPGHSRAKGELKRLGG